MRANSLASYRLIRVHWHVFVAKRFCEMFPIMAILASWQLCQCLQRMMENVEAIDFSAADDWRVLALWRKDLDQETETLSKALAALHEAEKKFKGEGRLPQDEAECDELFELLFSFGPDADPAALLGRKRRVAERIGDPVHKRSWRRATP